VGRLGRWLVRALGPRVRALGQVRSLGRVLAGRRVRALGRVRSLGRVLAGRRLRSLGQVRAPAAVAGGALRPCDRRVEWGLPDSVAIAVVRWRPKPHLAKENASNSRNRHSVSPDPGHQGTIWGRRRRQPSRSGSPVRPHPKPRREVAIPCVRRAIPVSRWQSRASAGPRWQVCAKSTAKNAQNCHLAGRSARDCHLAQNVSPRRATPRPTSRRAPRLAPTSQRPAPPPGPSNQGGPTADSVLLRSFAS
jgi:hypothetical protein